MSKVSEILTEAQKLSRDERRRLIIELSALEPQESSGAMRPAGSYAALRALSGAFHSDFRDISTDKYPHVAEAGSRH